MMREPYTYPFNEDYLEECYKASEEFFEKEIKKLQKEIKTLKKARKIRRVIL